MKFPFAIKDGAEFDAVGFGTNAVDHLIRVPMYPGHAEKIRLSGYSQMAGGEIASTMTGLRRLGLRTAYVGSFGDDAAGEIGRTSLVAEDVDISFSRTISGAPTQTAFIIVDDATGERTIIWNRDDSLKYTVDDTPAELMSRTKTLHMTPHDVEACIELAKRARSAGVVVSIDIDNTFDRVAELLPLIDVCIASSDLAGRLLDTDDQRTALQAIAVNYGCAVVGVTLGSAGSLFYSGGQFIETAGFAVPGGCVDTTGAGDAFRTGFLYGMLTGLSVERSAVLANAVAALKCRASGARLGLPSEGELDAFLTAI
ncbi:MAG: carbohydrate kinase family protein [Pyrinomonadaceae bacterium]